MYINIFQISITKKGKQTNSHEFGQLLPLSLFWTQSTGLFIFYKYLSDCTFYFSNLYIWIILILNYHPNLARYVVVYFSILYIRQKAGLVTDEMLSLPQTPFLAVGLLEALAAASGMAAAGKLSDLFISSGLFVSTWIFFSSQVLPSTPVRADTVKCSKPKACTVPCKKIMFNLSFSSL